MGKLDGKVALVTGGGTGIGRAASLLFATEGADVAVNYSRSEDDANKTCADIEALGRKAIAVKADVSDDSAVRQMVDRVVDELGRLDILVNSAGMTRFVPLDDLENLTEDDWDRAMAVNVKGAFFAARAAIPKMKESGGGSIVNVASISGISGKGQLNCLFRIQSRADLPDKFPRHQSSTRYPGQRHLPGLCRYALGNRLGCLPQTPSGSHANGPRRNR